MTSRLLAPWRTTSTWWTLVHVLVGLPIGTALFPVTVALLATTVGLLVTLPFAAVPLALLLVTSRLAARVERGRYRALLDETLADPVRPIPQGSAWTRTKSVLTDRARWKEVAYGLVRLPVSAVSFSLVLTSWCGSVALVLLPAYVSALPGDAARLGLFDVTFGPTAFALSFAGLVSLLAVAPWVTVLAGRGERLLARWLLAPPQHADLVVRAARAETGRVAAVDSAETERRRIERDLHDGAQQRLVALAMDLGTAREKLETDPEAGKVLVAEAHVEAKAALKEIRDLVRGIHPVILEDRGLDAALSAVVARVPIPVDLAIDVDPRPAAAVESAAYFVVSEALANVSRHAAATTAHVAIVRSGDRLVVEVRDNGRGGADPTAGTGLVGLRERVLALGGTFDLLSPAGGPTTLLVELPCAS